MRKKLEINENIMITCYPEHAHIFLIMDTDNHKSISWIFHNYLCLFYSRETGFDEFSVDFYSQYYPWHQTRLPNCPLIDYYRVPKFIVDEKYDDIVDFVIDSLDKNKFVMLYSARDYTPFHETFITGYDIEQQELDVWDFWPETNWKFCEKKVKFDWLRTNYKNVPKNLDDTRLKYLVLLEKNQEYKIGHRWGYETVLNFSIDDFIFIFENYIGKNNYLQSIANKDDGRWIGIQIYDLIIEGLKINISKNNFIPSHTFKVLVDHKSILKKAYISLSKELDASILKDLDDLLSEVKRLMNFILYCQIKSVFEEKLSQICTLLSDIKEKEIRVIENMLFEFKSTSINDY
ncbi:hypothetical protein [Sutcliffiella rhizosphaerae]|uniref:Uncharacterized protein n=1 Tax=Sutcliffiella rhizosphaerae TaxID=2880967 RepID=A0ABN8AHG7_9BACI|nr:hypothetical protein [Sutcliffiella rhizosphaerae]CAG9623684.1 hypothetical protein BACCIP111883_04516 [Sutcliffiella rhizosphaerae]